MIMLYTIFLIMFSLLVWATILEWIVVKGVKKQREIDYAAYKKEQAEQTFNAETVARKHYLDMLYEMQSALEKEDYGEKSYTVEVVVPYKLRNDITMLDDKEENKIGLALQRQMNGSFLRKTRYNLFSETIESFLYRVTNITFTNKKIGPYTTAKVVVTMAKNSMP